MNTDYETEISFLKQTIENMKKNIEEERKEFREFYQSNKKLNNNTSNYDNLYIDEDYYKESVYINTLKKQITDLIKENDILKIKICKLMNEKEEEFRI